MILGVRTTEMYKCLVLTVTLTLLPWNSFAQSVSGIHIGEPVNALDTLKLEPTAKEKMGSMESVKYRLVNRNELSVTYDGRANRIVYLECDWNRNSDGAASDFPGFTFGSTTLEEIRKINGSNGFSYKSNAMFTAEGKLVTFNAYLIKGKPGLVTVFVTALDMAEVQKRKDNKDPNADNVARDLKLDALIVADEAYLDQLWGTEKTYDKNAKPISWPVSQQNPNPRAR
jgi:hypothetical protein